MEVAESGAAYRLIRRAIGVRQGGRPYSYLNRRQVTLWGTRKTSVQTRFSFLASNYHACGRVEI